MLADGWLYPVWVVGATRMRDVDEDWPAVGTCLHHSVGVWPLVVSDSTEVLESQPGRLLRLRARGWPAGEAEVTDHAVRLRIGGTRGQIEEDAVGGPGRLRAAPLRDDADSGSATSRRCAGSPSSPSTAPRR